MSRALNVVAIGGGTGLPRLLECLRPLILRPGDEPDQSMAIQTLTAVVAVTDDGGSSGRLRADMGVLPPGDIRNCLVALSDAGEELRELFQYRFDGDNALSGHAFGNLFIAALTAVQGDVLKALASCHQILNIRGRILPASTQDLHLRAILRDGSEVLGEEMIGRSGGGIARVELSCPDCTAVHEAEEAVRRADLVILGPGSLYTSVIPNLLVPGIARALAGNRGHVLYIANLMTQPAETGDLDLEGHVGALFQHCPPLRLDSMLVHDGDLPAAQVARYAEDGAQPLAISGHFFRTTRIHRAPLVAPDGPDLKHDPLRLRGAVTGVLQTLLAGVEA